MGHKQNRTLKTWMFVPGAIVVFFIFLGTAYALDITLAWDLNPYVDGYKIYYKTGSSGPPYNGTEAAEGDSPIDIGYSSEFTLRALSDDNVHYITITAYKDDLESGYSNEVSTGRSVSTSSSSPAAAGGGDSGCFVSTLNPGVMERWFRRRTTLRQAQGKLKTDDRGRVTPVKWSPKANFTGQAQDGRQMTED